MICKYVILKHFLKVCEALTVEEWQMFCKKHIPCAFDEEKGEEEPRMFRFAYKALSFQIL